MRTLVIGATGIVGGSIVAQLVRRGVHPVALSRTLRSSPEADWIVGDLARPDAIRLPAVGTIYCTADIGLLADALPHLDTETVKRIVAFTSTSIVTKIASEIPEERDLLRRLADGETRLIAFCEQHGIAWTILRPTLIYAEGRDGNVSRLARLIRNVGFVPLMGSGGGLRQPVHADDLAVGAVDAADSARAANKTYAVPGGETLTYRAMVGRIFEALGRTPRIVSVPPFIWELAFRVAKPFFPTANVAMGRRMAKDMVFDASAAVADFAWTPRPFHPNFGEDARRLVDGKGAAFPNS